MFYFNKVIWPCTYYKIFRGVCVCVCVLNSLWKQWKINLYQFEDAVTSLNAQITGRGN